MPGFGTRCAVPSLTRVIRSAAFDASGIVPARWLRDLALVAPSPHISKTASAALHDGAALTDAIVITSARPPSSMQISRRRRAARAFRKHVFRKHLARASATPIDGMPGDLLRANASHPFEPRASAVARADLYDGKATTPIRECLARMIGVPRTPISPATAAGKSNSSMPTAVRRTSCGCSPAI
jgi:hypothetical protein